MYTDIKDAIRDRESFKEHVTELNRKIRDIEMFLTEKIMREGKHQYLKIDWAKLSHVK